MRFTRLLRPLCAVAVLLFSLSMAAGEARRGWSKLELTDALGRKKAVPQSLLHGFGASLVADYGSFSIVHAPAAALGGLAKAAAAQGWRARTRDNYDVLRLPGGNLDVREGVQGAPPDGLIHDYTNGRPGLFLIHFAGPPKQEWISELASMGWTLTRYVPDNGYIAIGVSSMRAPTRRLAYVQWVDFYHPYQKNASLAVSGRVQPLVFDLPTGPDLDDAIAAIAAAAEGPIRVDRGERDTLVSASMSSGSALRMLHQQLVIGVWPQLTFEAADERQVMSLTSNIDSTGSFPTATSATKYWSWVTSRCADCASMPSSQWKISIADTGVDGNHPDLAGRTSNGLLLEENTQCTGHCDWAGHGTLVAGIAAGNNALGFRDRLNDQPGDNRPENMGWFYGTGVAPTAGILITKVQSTSVYSGPASTADFIKDAACITRRDAQGGIEITAMRQPAVTIQNHSFEARQLQGTYSLLSRSYDQTVRDANGGFEGRPEVLVTIAAGNTTSVNDYYVATGAMAKNVLTVSGTDSWRPFLNVECAGDVGFRNIWKGSRTSSSIAGYIKPDVLAPASRITTTHVTLRNQKDFIAYCPKQVRAYYDGDWSSVPANAKTEYGAPEGGTSFAAPVAAGAALVVKRYMASTPQATSPALTKALLIAGARSIRDGEDRSPFPGTSIGSVPSQQQGFGRLSLVDLLDPSQPKPFVQDQESHYALLGSGDARTARLRVRDHTRPVKAVLVWADAPGNPTATNPDFDPLVNDLDLEIRPVGGTVVYLGNRMTADEWSIAYPSTASLQPDSVNNVEYARLSLAPNTEFDVVVKASRLAEDSDLSTYWMEQDWAIAVLNADVVEVFNPAALPGGNGPDAPANLQAVAQGNAVSLTWSPAADAVTYLVQRQTGTLPWESVLPYVTGTASADAPPSETRVVSYRVVAFSENAQSAPSATVSVCLAPAILSLTQTPEFRYGDTGSITVAATGPSLVYKWYRGPSGDISRPMNTATAASPTLTMTLQNTEYYWVRVTSTCMDGSVRSTNSSAVLYSVSPRISASPSSTVIPGGGRTLLSVTASGTYLTYQWYDTTGTVSTPIAGATDSTYLTSPATTQKKYFVRVTSGTAPWIDSSTATVNVCSGPTISSFSSTGSGDDFRFTVTVPASQMSLVTYRWYSGVPGVPNQSVDLGTGGDSRMFYNITPLPATFWARVAFTDGSCYSDTAGKTVP